MKWSAYENDSKWKMSRSYIIKTGWIDSLLTFKKRPYRFQKQISMEDEPVCIGYRKIPDLSGKPFPFREILMIY
jgi:hypothetical protein